MNKQLARALKEAKKYLAHNDRQFGFENKEAFICWSLDRAWLNGEITEYINEKAQHMIQDRIAPHGTACHWISAVTNTPHETLDQDKLQAWRHRWLDSMIKEFSN